MEGIWPQGLPFGPYDPYCYLREQDRDGSAGSSAGQQALGASPPETSSATSGPVSKVCYYLLQLLRRC
jgi:hypothetical protein